MHMSIRPSGRLSRPHQLYFVCSLTDAWLGEAGEMRACDKILGVLREADKPLTRKDIEDAAGVPESTVKLHLRELVKAGKVEKLGSNKNTTYKLRPSS